MTRLEDALGAIMIFALLFCGFWGSAGLNLPTGADELVQVAP